MATLYGWIITDDSDGVDGGSATSTIGPRSISQNIHDRLKAGEGTQFRMRCEGEVIYQGRIIDDRPDDYEVPPHESPCFGFEPLEDFGTPAYGCDDIQYKKYGKWTTI